MSELQGLQSRIAEIRALGYQLMVVSPDSVEDNRRVAGRLGLDFPVLSDAGLKLTKSLGLVHPGGAPQGHDVPRPATYIIRQNTIEWEYLTDNWRVRIPPDDLLEVLRTL